MAKQRITVMSFFLGFLTILLACGVPAKGTVITPHVVDSPVPPQPTAHGESASIVINGMWSFFNDRVRVAYSEHVLENGASTFEKTTPRLILMLRNQPEATRIVLPEQTDQAEIGPYTVEIRNVLPYAVDVEVSATSPMPDTPESAAFAGGYCEEYGQVNAGELAHFFDDHLRLGVSSIITKENEPALQLWVAVKDQPDLTQTVVINSPAPIGAGDFHIDILAVDSSSVVVRALRKEGRCHQGD